MSQTPALVRTFLAVYPDAATQVRLTELTARLRTQLTGVRWSPDHQLHFTLRFFGDLDEAARARAAAALAELTPTLAPVSFPLSGLGAFPDWNRARVIWVGAGAGKDALEEIARRLDIRFGEAGLLRADRPFRAHLTLARLREGERLDPTAVDLLRQSAFQTPPLTVSELRLMGSALGRAGATHTLLRAFPLGG